MSVQLSNATKRLCFSLSTRLSHFLTYEDLINGVIRVINKSRNPISVRSEMKVRSIVFAVTLAKRYEAWDIVQMEYVRMSSSSLSKKVFWIILAMWMAFIATISILSVLGIT